MRPPAGEIPNDTTRVPAWWKVRTALRTSGFARLQAAADDTHLLLDWLRSRNRHLGQSRTEHLSLSVSTGSPADAHPSRRSPRELVLARIPKPGGIDRRRRGRTRRRDPQQNAHTAIIAAETGGRIDG